MNQSYPCQKCNMDDGSPICLQDQRCPNQKPMNAKDFFAEAKRLNLRILGTAEETRAALDSKDAEIAQLKAKLNECADKALTYAASYEMAAARLVVAMGYMPPEQKRAFSAAWTEKRAELKPPWIEGLTQS